MLLSDVLPAHVILEVVHAMVTMNHALVAPDISGHASMARGMLVPDDHAVTDCKQRRHLRDQLG